MLPIVLVSQLVSVVYFLLFLF